MLSKTALLFGATGLVGSKLLHLLLESDRVSSLRAVLRRPLDIDHPKLEHLQCDFSQLEVNSSFFVGVDTVFICLGTTLKKAGSRERFREIDHDLVLRIAKMAQIAKIRCCSIVTALGAKEDSLFFYNRVKGELERDLRELHFPVLNIFRPSLILGAREERRVSENLSKKFSKFVPWALLPGGKRVRPVPAQVIAEAMCSAYYNSELSGVNGFNSDELWNMRL